MATINIGTDFSPDPLGRYRTDGNASGEAFREDYLVPALARLKPNEKIKIILDDGVEAYGSSFLSEGFAGVVKYGHMRPNDLLDKLVFQFRDPDFEFYKNKIIKYIKRSKFDSA